MGTRLAIYLTVHSVKELVGEAVKLNGFISLLSRLDIEKVYLENYRDGLLLDGAVVERAAKLFEKGFAVAGGAAIGTWGPGMGENAEWWRVCACISDERNVDVYVRAVTELAKVFNEVVIDDFWANWCYSKRDLDDFNSMFGLAVDVKTLARLLRVDREVQRLWALYSRELLVRTSRKVVEGAKNVNKDVQIVLKLAEWRENYLSRGLDLKAMTEVFDGIYLGTESREGAFRYGSTFIVDYVRAIVGDKLRGVWFDSYNGLALPSGDGQSEAPSWRFPPSAPEVFLEQFWHSLLGSVEEITLFQGTEYLENDREEHVALLERSIPRLRRLESLIDVAKVGLTVPAIQTSYRSPYDSYLEDALGSIGIPITAKRVDRLVKGDLVLFKESHLNCLNPWKLIEMGVSIMLTSAATERIAEGALSRDGLELIGAEDYDRVLDGAVDVVAFTDGMSTYIREHRRPYAYPVGPVLRAKNNVKVYLWALDIKGRAHPALYEVDHGSASVFVTSITKYPMNLVYGFHEVARQALRNVVYRFTGIRLEYRVPGGENQELSNISIVVYGNKRSAVLVNNNTYGSFFGITIDKDALGVKGVEGFALGSARIGFAEERNGVLRLSIDMARHSIDALTFA